MHVRTRLHACSYYSYVKYTEANTHGYAIYLLLPYNLFNCNAL